nr:hypothetical protein [Tanacetum cinerariifolium]
MDFVSADNTSSTNDVSTAYSVSLPSVSKSQKEGSSSYIDEAIHSFFANQSSAPQLDYDDLGQINNDDMEEIKRDGGYNGNKARDNERRPAYQDDSKALVTIDGEDIDWSGHVEEDTQNYAMMAYSSSNSEALKEKEDLKNKFKNWLNSSKNLGRLLNTQMSANHKFGLGYGDYRYGSILSYENEVLQSVFMNKETDLGDTHVNYRYVARMHTVPPPMTGNYMPYGPDVEIDYSKFTYGLKQTSVDESDSRPTEYASCESDSSVDITTSMPEPAESEPKVVCEPKVWTDALIIEEYDSNSDSDSVSNVQEDKEKPSFAFTYYDKHVKISRENVKEIGTPNHCPKVENQDRNGHTKKGLGYAFTRKSCFNDPHKALKDKGIMDSGCSRHMTGNKAHLADYQEFKGGFVAFGGSNGRITSKGKITAGRSDNETEFKNHELIEFYWLKGIKREYSKARTLQQNGVAKRKNRILIEAARTMLADLFLPTTFWSEAVNTACYVLNRVLVTKPQNKTPYEILTGRQPIINYLRPFGCHVTILNIINHLGKFDRKSNSRFLVIYSLNSKAFRVYNLETKRVEENLHVNFLENKSNVAGIGHAWMFDLDCLINSMNYEPVSVENQANKSAGTKKANNSAGTHTNDDQGANSEEIDLHDEHFILPIWSSYSTTIKSSGDKIEKTTDIKTSMKEATHKNQNANTNSTNLLNVVSTPISIVGPSIALNDGEPSNPDDPSMHHLEDIYDSQSEGIFTDSSYDDECVVTDFNNLETTVTVNPTPTTRIHTIHPKTQILRDHLSVVQTRSKVHKNSEARALEVTFRSNKETIIRIFNIVCLLVSYLKLNPKRSLNHWKMKFRLMLCKRNCYSSKFRRIEAIRIFLAFASYMGFIVYQMDVKSAFMYGTIDEEVYVTQPSGFVDLKFPNKVYKVVKALHGLHQAPKAWYATLSTFLEKSRYKIGAIDKTLFIKQDKKDIMLVQVYKKDGIFISQDKYVVEILKKFDILSVKTASTLIETQKPLVKDEEDANVDISGHSQDISPSSSEEDL